MFSRTFDGYQLIRNVCISWGQSLGFVRKKIKTTVEYIEFGEREERYLFPAGWYMEKITLCFFGYIPSVLQAKPASQEAGNPPSLLPWLPIPPG